VTTGAALGLLLAFWAMASAGGGLLLALLARRIHPALSLRRLWIFYTTLLSFAVAAILIIVWT
jgi:hypothetical protein